MFDPSSFANPTPLALADTSRDVLPRGGTSQRVRSFCRHIWTLSPNLEMEYGINSPNLEMVHAIIRQIWKRYNELVTKLRNPSNRYFDNPDQDNGTKF
ncbi:hypothetical protein TNCV_2371751 [Trichonephila clavipes]|nr:hypothetical protein TNCV_2371751 [Trichonephila clavipes]